MEDSDDMTKGSLVFIGLGLYDDTDISLKGLQELQHCDVVFAEFYTMILGRFDKKSLETTIGKTIVILSREETEKGDRILTAASQSHVGFITGGDPMIATTHVDLRLRAMQQGIPTAIVHSSSITTAVPGLLGLQNYKFGRTTTLAFPENEYFPTSPYTVIFENKKMGLHTLVLLDIQAEKKRYMTAKQGFQLLLQMEKKLRKHLITKNTLACVVARAGARNPLIAADTIQELQKRQFGPPLHTIVIPGDLHFMELDALELCANLPKNLKRKIQKL
jgi:diphthine synthase